MAPQPLSGEFEGGRAPSMMESRFFWYAYILKQINYVDRGVILARKLALKATNPTSPVAMLSNYADRDVIMAPFL